jgi:hypothetical protein
LYRFTNQYKKARLLHTCVINNQLKKTIIIQITEHEFYENSQHRNEVIGVHIVSIGIRTSTTGIVSGRCLTFHFIVFATSDLKIHTKYKIGRTVKF